MESNEFGLSLSLISCIVRRPTSPHTCLEPFPHGISASCPMLGVLLKESWRSVGNLPFYSHPCGQTHGIATPLLSTLMTWRSLSTVQKNLDLRQCLSGGHTSLHFPHSLMSSLPCRRLWVCNKGETYFPDSDFQSSSRGTTRPSCLVFCLGCVLMGITISPKRTLAEGGPTLSTGCETFVCVPRRPRHLCRSPLNNTSVASSSKRSHRIPKLFIFHSYLCCTSA